MGNSGQGTAVEVVLGNPGHGGFAVARHEGRVMLVRHGLPGETVVAQVTEDKGGSFCRADAVEVIDPSPHRVLARCPISGPGGSGCCDLSHAALPYQREYKAAVLRDQLGHIAKVDWDGQVEELPGTGDGTGWRTRVRLGVDRRGQAGFHSYRGSALIPTLTCPQAVPGALEGVAQSKWRPGSEVQVAVDSDGTRHLVQILPPRAPGGAKGGPGERQVAAQRRAAAAGPRKEQVVVGSGRAVQRVGDRAWELSPTGFWQAHTSSAQVYSQVVAEWAGLTPGEVAWDLYGGVGVFAAALADQVGDTGVVEVVELSAAAVADGHASLRDLPQVGFHAGRVEKVVPLLTSKPDVVVLDPPRAGAGKEVVAAVAAAGPRRIVHIGCDPSSLARDLGLYQAEGYRLAGLRAFDAFPMTHHVEGIALLER